jgi:hypothetical protein
VGAIVSQESLTFSSRIAFDVLGQSGLNGSSMAVADPNNPGKFASACAIDDWQNIVAYEKTIRSPRRPTTLVAAEVTKGQMLFTQGNCQGCHGGAKWTLSRVFYTPDVQSTTNALLTTKLWGPAAALAGFPPALLPATTPAMQAMRYAGTAKGTYDQLTCVLRPVGTFGVAETAVGTAELRGDLVTVAQGNETDGKGFNPPSLLGMTLGAPYFHGGQVRTLEAMFSEAFAAHFRALAPPTFLAATDPNRAAEVSALIAYVLAIDEDQAIVPTPPLGPTGGDLCAAP